MNQVLFEKIYASSDNDTPLKDEARFNPPFDMIIDPFREELREVNQAAKLKTRDCRHVGDCIQKIARPRLPAGGTAVNPSLEKGKVREDKKKSVKDNAFEQFNDFCSILIS